jgi:hypothetical protein
LKEYDTFVNHGKNGKAPPGFKKIVTFFIYAVKHDGRHKSRLVAGGHLTEVPIESVNLGVVTLKGLRLIMFLAKLNHLEIWATDVGNAYLEAKTQEKVYIIAGPEFGELEGHLLVVFKALYRLRTSGLRWHERFADSLRDMGFFTSKADSDISMQMNGQVYVYIAVYVDDLCIVAIDPKKIIDLLTEKYSYRLKGSGPIKFHLGCDYFRDSDGILCYAPKRYIEKVITAYKGMFGTNLKEETSTLVKGDHPELAR